MDESFLPINKTIFLVAELIFVWMSLSLVLFKGFLTGQQILIQSYIFGLRLYWQH